MFNSHSEKYLLDALAKNKVVLFLGAGFSADATNALGQNLPLGKQLASGLWHLLGWDEKHGEFDGSSLPAMYGAALTEGVPHQRLQDFLEARLLVRLLPPQYQTITNVYWYRIYTTNVDDAVQQAYATPGAPRLVVLSHPKDDVRDRDQTLASIQLIHLNGRLPCSPTDITFSVTQYASRAGQREPLWEQFVRDYSNRPTLFIGTELDESLLWQAIVERQGRDRRLQEFRAESFLVIPKISPAKRSQLAPYNVTPIEGTAAQFLEWLQLHVPALPNRRETLRVALPSLAELLDKVEPEQATNKDLNAFGTSFHLVPPSLHTAGDRSLYLLGATPRWEDVYRDLDAPRHLTEDVFQAVLGSLKRDPGNVRVLVILGSAGCGKSTILRRLGLRLLRSGHTTFLTNSEDLPSAGTVREAVRALLRPIILLFDNSEIALHELPSIIEETQDLDYPPTIVIASRTNDFERRGVKFHDRIPHRAFDVPDLARDEIEDILGILGSQGLLGRLTGMSLPNQVRQFEDVAHKQILVAMREATTGEGFDKIIRDEFHSLADHETQLMYLCIALATDAGYRLTTQEIVAASHEAPAKALNILIRHLAKIAVPTGAQQDLWLLRHRFIAEFVLAHIAPPTMLAEAYERLLRVLSIEVAGTERKTRAFRLYKELINHIVVHGRFPNVDDARHVYESVKNDVAFDPHFWLQYGTLEVEYGNLGLAETYLRSAESLWPNSKLVQVAIGHLFLKQAVEAPNISQAVALRQEASEILERDFERGESPHSYHIYCHERMRYCARWIGNDQDKLGELEHLRETVKRARAMFPRNRHLQVVEERIQREYLSLALP